LLDTLPKGNTPQIVFEKLYLLQSLALEHYQRGEFPEARKAYEQMNAINPSNVLALNNLAYLLMEHFNDPKSALPYSRQAANTVPSDPNILDTVGWNHVLLGNYDLGLSALRRAIGMDDGLPAVHYHAAEACYRRGQADKTGRDTDLREAEIEIKRAHELIRARGADTEGIFDKVLALGEKLGVKLDPKLGPK
jgi:tetratricopeptide (TPR) repeat protein